MRCYFVLEQVVHEGFIVLDDKGIGLDGRFMLIPSEEFMPSPEQSHGYQEVPFKLDKGQFATGSIRYADIFQFKDKKDLRIRYRAYIHREQEKNTSDVLVLWATYDNGLFNFDRILAKDGAVCIDESTSHPFGTWQAMIKMVPGSSVIGVNKYHKLVMTWDGEDLNVAKKSIK